MTTRHTETGIGVIVILSIWFLWSFRGTTFQSPVHELLFFLIGYPLFVVVFPITLFRVLDELLYPDPKPEGDPHAV